MKKRIWIAKLSIMAIAISAPIVITDQYFRYAQFPRNNSRVMLLSGGQLYTSNHGIRQYTPNSSLRHSAVYGDSLQYSYAFKTDRNGFRLTYECKSENAARNLAAITGDSFTEGQGSNSSWTERLQEELCEQGYNSINAAIAGYGVEEMKDSLDYAHEKLNARKAIIAIIPEDIFRPRSPMISNSTCSMYKSRSRRCGDSATWWHHSEELTAKDLIEFANSKYDFGVIPALNPLKSKLKLTLKQLIGIKPKNTKSEMMDRSISAMKSITSKYGAKNLSLVILPTKDDRDLASSPEDKKIRNDHLRTFLGSLPENISVIDLRDCPLDASHFLSIDGHPNEKGHKQLGICATNRKN